MASTESVSFEESGTNSFDKELLSIASLIALGVPETYVEQNVRVALRLGVDVTEIRAALQGCWQGQTLKAQPALWLDEIFSQKEGDM